MKTIAALTLSSFAAAGLFAGSTGNVAETQNYSIDNSHSAVIFRIKHLGVSYCYGRFNEIEGRLSLSDSDDSANRLEIKIKAASIDSNDKQRDDHLRGPDFFNVKQFPEITFKSKTFKKTAGSKYMVTGDLTLHGVTKSVSVDLDHVGSGKDPWGGERTGFEGTFEVKRSEYGISYMPGGLGEDVRITVSLEGVKK